MPRHFHAFLFFFGITVAPFAGAGEDQFGKEHLYTAIEQSDYEQAETAFDTLQQSYLRRETNADDMRDLFTVFSTNNPEFTVFVTEWLDSYPGSPYAQTAMARIYSKTAWHIRGQRRASEIYPAALVEFRYLHDQAWDYAHAAYAADPSFVPATDSLLEFSNATGQRRQAYKVLEKAMALNPDMRTLRNGLYMTAPGWGGSWKAAEDLCEHYGPMIEWKDGDPVLFCKVFAGAAYHGEEKGDWARGILAQGGMPELDFLRLRRATHGSATRAEAAFAYDYLTREGVTDHEHARSFDEQVALNYGYDFLSEAHQRREKENAATALKHDPYNPDLLEIMAASISRFERTGETYRIRSLERPTAEEELDLTRRMLIAAPYDHRRWQKYSSLLKRRHGPRGVLLNEPANINAVVYSNHRPGIVIGYAHDKWNLLAGLNRLDTDPQSEMWQSLTEEQRALAEEQRQMWLAVREALDLDQDLRCPMMRAYRLHQLICETGTDMDCDISPERREMLEIVKSDVNRRGVCTSVMAAPDPDLFFMPIPVDLTVPEG